MRNLTNFLWQSKTQVERQWRNYNDIKNSLDTARRKGMIKGLEECCARILVERQKVINQSCADGKELLSTEVDERLLRVARRLLLLDVPVREVSQCTLLPVEFLSKMKEKEWAQAVGRARALLAEGVSVEDTSDITDLLEWEVARLAKK